MNAEILFTSTLAVIDKPEGHEFIRIIWDVNKLEATPEYMEVMEKIIELLQKLGIQNILVDQRKIMQTGKNAVQYTAKQWFPKFLDLKGGKGNIIIISSPSTFRNITSKSVSKRMLMKHSQLVIRHCETESKAVEYMKMIEEATFF